MPTPAHRLALDACAHVRVLTEPTLAAALPGEDAQVLFGWLRGLSFVEQGPGGHFPHDLAREVLDADLRWRNPEEYRRLHHRTFREAGLPVPRLIQGARVEAGPASPIYAWMEQTTRTLLPLMERTGVATAVEVAVETLAERLREEAVARDAVLVPPPLIGAWARTGHC